MNRPTFGLLPCLAAALAIAALAITAPLGGNAHAQVEVPADWAYVPADLGPGDEFRLIFASTGHYQAQSSDPDNYHNIIRTSAAAATTYVYVEETFEIPSGPFAGGVYTETVPRAVPSELRDYSSHFSALVNTRATEPNLVVGGGTEPSGIKYKVNTWSKRDPYTPSSTIESASPPLPTYWVGGARIADDDGQLVSGVWHTGGGDVRNEHGGALNLEASYNGDRYDNFWFATGMYEKTVTIGHGNVYNGERCIIEKKPGYGCDVGTGEYYNLGGSYVGCTYYAGDGDPGLGDRVCSDGVKLGLFGISDVFRVAGGGGTTEPPADAPSFLPGTIATTTEGGRLVMSLRTWPATTSPVDVSITLTHVGNVLPDSVAGTHVLTFPANATGLYMWIPTIDDKVADDNCVRLIVNPGSDYKVSVNRGDPNGKLSKIRDADTGQSPVGTCDPGTGMSPSLVPPTPEISGGGEPAVSLTGSSNGGEGDPVSYTIEASPAPVSTLLVYLNVSHAGGILAGEHAGLQNVTVPTSGSLTVTVPTLDDSINDTNTITVTILDGDGYSVDPIFYDMTIDIPDDDTDLEYGRAQGSTAVAVDPALIAGVEELAAQAHHGQEHVERWTRALAALGGAEHQNPTTAAEARENAERYSSPLWPRIADVLELLEAEDPPQQQDPPQQTPPEIDPALISGVRELASQAHHGHEHVDRWTRVLAAFGEADHDSPMTAAEARANSERYSSPLWPQIADVLAARE